MRCLGQRWGANNPIYACADLTLDGYSLGVTQDGVTFNPVMSFTQLQGPLACAPVQQNCQAHWERIQGVLGIGSAGGGTDAGAGGGGGGGTPASSGSHCGTAGVDFWSVLVAAAFATRRRRRTA